jgi:hypothetical protein
LINTSAPKAALTTAVVAIAAQPVVAVSPIAHQPAQRVASLRVSPALAAVTTPAAPVQRAIVSATAATLSAQPCVAVNLPNAVQKVAQAARWHAASRVELFSPAVRP